MELQLWKKRQSNTFHVCCLCWYLNDDFELFHFSRFLAGPTVAKSSTTSSFQNIWCCIFCRKIKWSIEKTHYLLLNSIPFYLHCDAQCICICTHTHSSSIPVGMDIFDIVEKFCRRLNMMLAILGIGKQWKQQANEQTDERANVYGCTKQLAMRQSTFIKSNRI